jgi:hypothetical protein
MCTYTCVGLVPFLAPCAACRWRGRPTYSLSERAQDGLFHWLVQSRLDSAGASRSNFDWSVVQNVTINFGAILRTKSPEIPATVVGRACAVVLRKLVCFQLRGNAKCLNFRQLKGEAWGLTSVSGATDPHLGPCPIWPGRLWFQIRLLSDMLRG